MQTQKNRRKMIEAMGLFIQGVKYPSKLKLFKLLFFLDFEMYKHVGRSVTGLDYAAWPFGPVPPQLFKEFEEYTEDLNQKISLINKDISKDETEKRLMIEIRFRGKPDESVFTPRELKKIQELIEIYKEASPSQMSEITHLRNSPWDKTRKEKGDWETIDPILALDSDAAITSAELVLAIEERTEFLSNYSALLAK
jgi:uncharacterized phage-associated protein